MNGFSFYPNLLFRTLAKNNLAVMFPALTLGVGVYLLTDLFDKLDNFMEVHLGFSTVLLFFLYKTPMIISQLLPVIFLLAVVIQLCLMHRSREIMALQAGGISLLQPAKILFMCGIFAAVTQLCFSEVLGVVGNSESTRIWEEQVRHRYASTKLLSDLWFHDVHYIVHLETLDAKNAGTGFMAYKLADDNITVQEIILAEKYASQDGKWALENVSVTHPDGYNTDKYDEMTLQLRQRSQDLRSFNVLKQPSQLSIWELTVMIQNLSAAGSNVESLKTAWHNKLSYAASLIVMALLGVAIVSITPNVYLATGLALIATFFYYMLFTVFTSIGEKGLLSPMAASWAADAIGVAVAGIRLLPMALRQRRKGKK